MIKGSHYESYVKERSGGTIVEDERGFISYRFRGKECFLADMYIAPEFRQCGKGRSLLMVVAKEAMARGCECITANVYVDDPGHAVTLIAAFRSGFKIASAHAGVLLIVKELEVQNG